MTKKKPKEYRKTWYFIQECGSRVFDYDRIEFYDEEHSVNENRYNTIGDIEAGKISGNEKKTEKVLL